LAGDAQSSKKLSRDLQMEMETLFQQTKKHALYQLVSQLDITCDDDCDYQINMNSNPKLDIVATLFLLSIPRELLLHIPHTISTSFLELRNHESFTDLELLKEEVSRMELQWQSFCLCGTSTCTK
jgi:hypothetical protein